MDIIKILLMIFVVYVLAAIYFGIVRKTKIYGGMKKLFKIIIFIVIVVILIIMFFPSLVGY